MLDDYGHEQVSVLDGGIVGWRAAGGELSTTSVEVAAGDVLPGPIPARRADLEQVREAILSDTVMVCNALSAESYEEGSIEGWANMHATSLFADGDIPLFRVDEVLTDILADAGYQDGVCRAPRLDPFGQGATGSTSCVELSEKRSKPATTRICHSPEKARSSVTASQCPGPAKLGSSRIGPISSAG